MRKAGGTTIVACLLSACLAMPLSAQGPAAKQETAAQSDQTKSSATEFHAPDASLRLGPGDLLDISVYNVPELTSKARINNSGDIHLPLINYVHVEGLTPEQAERIIEKRLDEGRFVRDPHVTVFVEQSASQGASVLGEVARPGIYPVIGEQRLFDVLSAAGGLTEKAGRSITLTHRSQPEAQITIPVSRNLEDSPASNLLVLAGDTIIVRKADVVYVVGDVGKPSGLLMENGRLTVLQAIALAGGTTRTARLGAARIIRKGPNGMSETPVALKRILEAKAPDLAMQADDILFVPTSAGKAFAGHTLQNALQAAAAATIITAFP